MLKFTPVPQRNTPVFNTVRVWKVACLFDLGNRYRPLAHDVTWEGHPLNKRRLFIGQSCNSYRFHCFIILVKMTWKHSYCKLVYTMYMDFWQNLKQFVVVIKEHLALDRSSWSLKRRFYCICIWLERCCKSRIQWSKQTCLKIARFSFYLGRPFMESNFWIPMADRVSSQSNRKTTQFRGKFVRIIVFYF